MNASSLRWQGNEPFSESYGDFYFSPGAGSAAAEHIFLKGNGLPEAWEGRRNFVIAELGFGAGINLFETLRLWKETRKPGQRLSFITFEKHPFSREDFSRALAGFPQYEEFAQILLPRLPIPVPGYHHVSLPEFSLSLTLAYGEAVEMLRKGAGNSVHTWFLDGFAPSKNPEMWSEEIFQEIYRWSADAARFSTFSSAGSVRRAALSAGFHVEKFPGFQGKRESLKGWKNGKLPTELAPPESVAIVGAGLAGCALAESFSERCAKVTLFYSAPEIFSGASGNPIALVNPYPCLDTSILSEWTTAGFLHALQWYQGFEDEFGKSPYQRKETLQYLSTRRLEKLAVKLREGHQKSPLFDLAEADSQQNAFLFPESGQILPALLKELFLRRFQKAAVQLRLATQVSRLEYKNNRWFLFESFAGTENTLGEFDLVVLANSADAAKFSQTTFLPVEAVRGQLTIVQDRSEGKESRIQCFDGYLSAPFEGQRVLGASYDHDNLGLEVRPQENLEMINRASTWLGADATPLASDIIASRVSLRCSSYDRLPFVGPAPDWSWMRSPEAILERGKEAPLHPQLFLATGFGSRGFSSCKLAAEMIASEAFSEPCPVTLELRQALRPSRATRRLFKELVELGS